MIYRLFTLILLFLLVGCAEIKVEEISTVAETTTASTSTTSVITTIKTTTVAETTTTSTTPLSDSGDEYITHFLTENNYDFADVSHSNQLIIVDSCGTEAAVYCYEKSENFWEMVHFSGGVVGKNGTSQNKTESDCYTPKGIFSIGFGFGTELIDTKIDYRLINDNCYWIDDPESEFYNQWVESGEIYWKSAEHLIEYPQSYHYGVVINYNMNPVKKGAGSAIFLHCMTGRYTAGCVAVAEDDMVYIMQWLDKEETPLIVIS